MSHVIYRYTRKYECMRSPCMKCVKATNVLGDVCVCVVVADWDVFHQPLWCVCLSVFVCDPGVVWARTGADRLRRVGRQELAHRGGDPRRPGTEWQQ